MPGTSKIWTVCLCIQAADAQRLSIAPSQVGVLSIGSMLRTADRMNTSALKPKKKVHFVAEIMKGKFVWRSTCI